jgi:hypothetical protein
VAPAGLPQPVTPATKPFGSTSAYTPCRRHSSTATFAIVVA